VLFDLHVHSEGGVQAMFEHAKELGLDGLGFADGHEFEAADEIRGAAEATGLRGFCGATVATNRGVLVCYFPELDQVKGSDWVTLEDDKLPAAADVIKAVEERGGVTIAAHPYYKSIPSPMGDHIFSLEGLHACEAASPLTTGMQRDLAIEASDSLSLPCTGGSSARTSEHVGLAVTFIPDEIESEADLCRVIREKKCYALMTLDEVPPDARPSQPARPRQDRRGGGRGRGRRPRRRD